VIKHAFYQMVPLLTCVLLHDHLGGQAALQRGLLRPELQQFAEAPSLGRRLGLLESRGFPV
jgi:hypothetical protein